MDPLWILAAGMVVVVGSVVFLKLHAFLALLLGALTVGALTTDNDLQRYASGYALQQRVKSGKSWSASEEAAVAHKELERVRKQTVMQRVVDGFGRTAGGIGILIGMAAIIGKCLIDSGAADRIVRTALGWVGERNAPLAFLGSGFFLGIPVFFDTVFYLMLPLGKAMHMRTGRNYLLYILSIGAGATMSHSLVPPTPGPLLVAEALQIPLGQMILGGCLVGSVTVIVGYLYAVWLNGRVTVPLRESTDLSLKDLEELAARDESLLPPFWLSILPIFLPVVLIGGQATVEELVKSATADPSVSWAAAMTWAENNGLVWAINTFGDQNLAIILSAAIAILTLVYQRRVTREELADSVQSALLSAGIVILITAGGGAFGGVLQQTGIGPRIAELAQTYEVPMIPLAFFVTALIRTAQGSATVAMITGAGIMAGVFDPAEIHPLYIALAIGCGSKPFAWMNDSGFWVVCRMTGMTDMETVRYWSPMSSLMGLSGLATVSLAAWLFPLH